jgi:hypothetical protein
VNSGDSNDLSQKGKFYLSDNEIPTTNQKNKHE